VSSPTRPAAAALTDRGRRGTRFDLIAVAVAALVVLATALIGRALLAAGVSIFLPFPPLLAHWEPHVGPGSLPAVVIAVSVVCYGPELAARMHWGGVLVAGWAAATVWTLSLALIDGYREGI
jgi:hypothetical protein